MERCEALHSTTGVRCYLLNEHAGDHEGADIHERFSWNEATEAARLRAINAGVPWSAPKPSAPTHRHDCARCVYLGTEPIEGRLVDWYHCPGILGGTMVGRYSDEGRDYYSAPVSVLRANGPLGPHSRAALARIPKEAS